MHGKVDPDSNERAPLRSPPKRICCLLPVWGRAHVRHFLELGLPTLLAPGNIPAISAALPTEFVFLTSQDDAAVLQAHPGFRRLSQECKVYLHSIDHLITATNHSVTVTLAYAEAVRAFGADMLDTCFVFLVSDYVMADGSLAALLRRMRNGASGIQAGNFQLDEDSARPWLEERIAASRGRLSLSARELLTWGFSHLHPITVANIVNFGLAHNTHTNRLFWRVDAQTMIGRFHLMHMICIRPEVTDFVIGASCDYSFIPEMCPSGNVETITDSDEYLVLEMQPKGHESRFLRPGRLSPRRHGWSLNQWATALHLANAQETLVFHAGELPQALSGTVQQADLFFEQARRYGRRTPLPHRGHPYWFWGLASFKEATGIPLALEERPVAFGMPYPGPITDPKKLRMLWRATSLAFGVPPRLRRWHPLWTEYEMLRQHLDALRRPKTSLLMLANRPSVLTVGFADGGRQVVRMRTAALLGRSASCYASLAKSFDVCSVELAPRDIRDVRGLLDRVVPMMRHRGTIVLSLSTRHGFRKSFQHARLLETCSSVFFHPRALQTRFYFVPTSWTGRLRLALVSFLVTHARRRSVVGAALLAALSPIFLVGNFVSSFLGRSTTALSGHRHVRSVLVEMMVDGSISDPAEIGSLSATAWPRIPNPVPAGHTPDLARLLHPTSAPTYADVP